MPVPPSIPLPSEVVQIVNHLQENGFQARLVGGSVRDRLLGLLPKDFDIATDATPHEIIALFTPIARKVLPTGIAFGTVTIRLQALSVEVTTLRTDVSCDGRKAVVKFSSSFKEDALRRDFTINALSQKIEGEIYDYCQGLNDLTAKRVRFIGVARERIREDYLRILRYFRFQLQLGFTGDAEALHAIGQEVQGLVSLSRERITQELRLIFSAPLIYPCIVDMQASGVLQAILPVACLPVTAELLPLLNDIQEIEPEKRFLARLFLLSLCKNKSSPVQYTHFALTRQEIKILASLQVDMWTIPDKNDLAAQFHWIDTQEVKGGKGSFLSFFFPLLQLAFRFLKEKSHKMALDRLRQAEVEFGARRIEEIPLHGQDLMEGLPVESGAPLGALLRHLHDEFRRGTWRTRAEGLHLAAELWRKKGSA